MGARKLVPPYQPPWEKTQLNLFGSLPCLQEAGAGLGHPLKTCCVAEASGLPSGTSSSPPPSRNYDGQT